MEVSKCVLGMCAAKILSLTHPQLWIKFLKDFTMLQFSLLQPKSFLEQNLPVSYLIVTFCHCLVSKNSQEKKRLISDSRLVMVHGNYLVIIYFLYQLTVGIELHLLHLLSSQRFGKLESQGPKITVPTVAMVTLLLSCQYLHLPITRSSIRALHPLVCFVVSNIPYTAPSTLGLTSHSFELIK